MVYFSEVRRGFGVGMQGIWRGGGGVGDGWVCLAAFL